jgi:multidrug efflux pump
MVQGGDIIELGRNLDMAVKRNQAALPVGIEMHSGIVQRFGPSRARSMNSKHTRRGRGFGRAGELCIVVAAIGVWSRYRSAGAGRHVFPDARVRYRPAQDFLGALVLLGPLVDDAIIVEMMATKMEQAGIASKRQASLTPAPPSRCSPARWSRRGFTTTARSSTGEYTRSIFQVSVIALLLSWVAAVVFIPYLGYKLLPDPSKSPGTHSGMRGIIDRVRARLGKAPSGPSTIVPSEHPNEHAVYETPFYQRFRKVVNWCVTYRTVVLASTVGLFVLSLLGFGLVQQQFFPDSTRPELLVELRLPEGSSFFATEAEVKKLEAILAKEPNIENYVATSAPAARASTCRLTNNWQAPTLPSSLF